MCPLSQILLSISNFLVAWELIRASSAFESILVTNKRFCHYLLLGFKAGFILLQQFDYFYIWPDDFTYHAFSTKMNENVNDLYGN